MAPHSRPISCYMLFVVCLFPMLTPIWTGCPQPDLLYPCSCHHSIFGTHVFCGGDSYINLENIFESLSAGIIDEKKHFSHLTISNTAINELNDNVLKDITFEAILIDNAHSLTAIKRNAFTETNWYTRSLVIKHCPRLSTQSEELFEVVSKMKNLRHLELNNVNLTDIPNHAFKPINGYQTHLETITLSGRSIQRLGSNSFRYLSSLKSITFIDTSIDTIPAHAFSFGRPSQTKLFVAFVNNTRLNANGFAKDSLSHVWRPMQVSGITATLLGEEVFASYLNSNEQNIIEISGQRFDCHNCLNLWIRRNTEYYYRIIGINCSTGYEFMHNNNFINCKH